MKLKVVANSAKPGRPGARGRDSTITGIDNSPARVRNASRRRRLFVSTTVAQAAPPAQDESTSQSFSSFGRKIEARFSEPRSISTPRRSAAA
jgi:hypothetical protein